MYGQLAIPAKPPYDVCTRAVASADDEEYGRFFHAVGRHRRHRRLNF